ncbi:hypothetical protein Hanom_Chr10g00902141 [Helianthus anomalus]
MASSFNQMCFCTACCTFELVRQLFDACKPIFRPHDKQFRLRRLQYGLVVSSKQNGSRPAERVTQAHIAHNFIHLINCRPCNRCTCILDETVRDLIIGLICYIQLLSFKKCDAQSERITKR